MVPELGSSAGSDREYLTPGLSTQPWKGVKALSSSRECIILQSIYVLDYSDSIIKVKKCVFKTPPASLVASCKTHVTGTARSTVGLGDRHSLCC